MRFSWLEVLLPETVLSLRTEIWWLLFFALFPLAYAGGVMLEFGDDGPARMTGALDRADSIHAAREFAESKGFPVTGWHQFAILETHGDLTLYYEAKQPSDAKRAQLADISTLAPARDVQVLFRSPDQNHEFRVFLSLSGRVVGYDIGKYSAISRNVTSRISGVTINTTSTSDDDEGSMKNAIQPDDMQAEATAREVLASNAALNDLVKLGPGKVRSNSDDSVRREIAWDVVPKGRNELTLQIRMSVRDQQVVAQHMEALVDKDYVKTKLPKGSSFPTFLKIVYGLFLSFGAIYAIYRYAKRTLQKEVSHVRALMVGALFFGAFSILSYSGDVDMIATRLSGEMLAKAMIPIAVSVGLTFAIMGMLVGVAYGSGEGALREAYPGKLTSLDALLAGRIFSRNVAASILFGAAASGWFLLFSESIGNFLTSDLTALRSDILFFTFSRLPWLTLLLGLPYSSLLIAVSGLLLPSAFLARRSKRGRRRYGGLILFAILAVLLDASKYPTVPQSLLAMATLVAALLLPFFAFDLLAAIVSLSVLTFVTELARLAAVFPSWTELAVWLGALSTLGLVVAAYVALHGRPVREEDVRPLYAKNLAERMSLQAEVMAAREAQLRLLPQSAPDLPGIQLAACCLPARGVGGDFYDFFPLDANRLAIFVAQGGDQGLASALCIALAKGVLMHAALQAHSPTEILVTLEASIAELLEGGSASKISFAYGVMDTRRNLLTYARLGASPRFVSYRVEPNATPARQSAIRAPLERVVSVPGRAKNAPPIYEGSAPAYPGEYLIFFTRGVANVRLRRFGKREYEWLEGLMRDLVRTEQPLQNLLATALAKYQHRASDDLTAVVLRVTGTQAALQEGVA